MNDDYNTPDPDDVLRDILATLEDIAKDVKDLKDAVRLIEGEMPEK